MISGVDRNTYYNYVLLDLAKQIPPYSELLIGSSVSSDQKIIFIEKMLVYLKTLQNINKDNSSIIHHMITTVFDIMNQSLQKFFHKKIKLTVSRYIGGLKRSFKGLRCDKYYVIYDPSKPLFWYHPDHITVILKKVATYLNELMNEDLHLILEKHNPDDYNELFCKFYSFGYIYNILSYVWHYILDLDYDCSRFSNNIVVYDTSLQKFYRKRYGHLDFGKEYPLCAIIGFFANEDARQSLNYNKTMDISPIQVAINNHMTMYDIAGIINYYTGLQLTVLCSSYPYIAPNTISLKSYDEEEQH